MFEFVPTAHAAELEKIFAFGKIESLSQGIARLTGPAFSIAALGVTFYLLYAAYKMIIAGPDKGALEASQRMVTHSIIGFVLLMMMYAVIRFVFFFLGLQNFSIF